MSARRNPGPQGGHRRTALVEGILDRRLRLNLEAEKELPGLNYLALSIEAGRQLKKPRRRIK